MLLSARLLLFYDGEYYNHNNHADSEATQSADEQSQAHSRGEIDYELHKRSYKAHYADNEQEGARRLDGRELAPCLLRLCRGGVVLFYRGGVFSDIDARTLYKFVEVVGGVLFNLGAESAGIALQRLGIFKNFHNFPNNLRVSVRAAYDRIAADGHPYTNIL